MSVKLAQNSFLFLLFFFFETFRTRYNVLDVELYCFEGLFYSLKVTPHCNFQCIYVIN